MADEEKKKYYWIKLKKTFMTSDTVDFLMSQPNGAEYVVLYQMLCLKTINTNGELARQIGELIIPFNIDKIQRDTKFFSVDTIRVALTLYKQLELVYEQDNGVLKISDFDNMVGSECSSAERVRNFRLKKRQKIALQCNTQSNSEVTQEYRDKILEYRDKILDTRDKEINKISCSFSSEKNESETTKPKDSVKELLFEEFWKEYPRKVNKKNALKAYLKALNSKDEQIIKDKAKTILQGLQQARALWKAEKREPQYIPHSASWLNQERWKDELDNTLTSELGVTKDDFSEYDK